MASQARQEPVFVLLTGRGLVRANAFMSRAAKGTSSPSASGCRRRTRRQNGGAAKIKADDIAALKARGVGATEMARPLGIGRTGLRSVSLLGEDRGDEPEGAAVPAAGRPLHRGDRRHGLSGVFAAGVRQRRHRRPIRHECRHRAAVFPAWGAAVTPGGFGRRIALAAAHRGACLDVRSVSGVGPWREGAVSGSADAAALEWRDPALRTAFDSPVVDRLHLDRSRQRPGRALRRDRIQPFGHGIDAAAGRAAAGRAGLASRRAAPATSSSSFCSPSPPASLLGRGSATGRCGTRRCLVWWTADQSCWWSTPLSARASHRASGAS